MISDGTVFEAKGFFFAGGLILCKYGVKFVIFVNYIADNDILILFYAAGVGSTCAVKCQI